MAAFVRSDEYVNGWPRVAKMRHAGPWTESSNGWRNHIVSDVETCWCLPDVDGDLTLHRQVMCTSDSQDRMAVFSRQ